jgi:hypothetical protein
LWIDRTGDQDCGRDSLDHMSSVFATFSFSMVDLRAIYLMDNL